MSNDEIPEKILVKRTSEKPMLDAVITERTMGPPILIEGETIELSVKHGFPATMLVISMIITFIPPFVWGAALLVIMHYERKHDGVWVTNKRLVDFGKVPFSKKYAVTSVPLEEITNIRHARGGGLSSLIDRLFGVGDVQIFVKASRWAQCSIGNIKSPSKLIEHVRKVTNAKA